MAHTKNLCMYKPQTNAAFAVTRQISIIQNELASVVLFGLCVYMRTVYLYISIFVNRGQLSE